MPAFNDSRDYNCLAILVSKNSVDLIKQLNDDKETPQEFLETPAYYVMPFGEAVENDSSYFKYADDFYEEWASGDETFPEQMKGRPILIIRSE